jgi:hypothetical protein
MPRGRISQSTLSSRRAALAALVVIPNLNLKASTSTSPPFPIPISPRLDI